MKADTTDPAPRTAHCDYAFIQVRALDENLEEATNRVCELAQGLDMEWRLFPPSVVLAGATRVKRRAIIESMTRLFQGNFKLLYGSGMGHTGFIASKSHLLLATSIPNFTEMRHRVNEMQWGTIEEFKLSTDVEQKD